MIEITEKPIPLETEPQKIWAGIIHSTISVYSLGGQHGWVKFHDQTMYSPRFLDYNLEWPKDIKPGWYVVDLTEIMEQKAKYVQTGLAKGGLISPAEVKIRAPVEKIDVAILLELARKNSSSRTTTVDDITSDVAKKLEGSGPFHPGRIETPSYSLSGKDRKKWWKEFGDQARLYAREHHLKGPSLTTVIEIVTPSEHPLLEAYKKSLSERQAHQQQIAAHSQKLTEFYKANVEWEPRYKATKERIFSTIQALLQQGLLREEEDKRFFIKYLLTNTPILISNNLSQQLPWHIKLNEINPSFEYSLGESTVLVRKDF